MDEKLHHTSCPVCGSKSINPLLTVKDHSVTKEDFVIWQCNNCTLRFTQDVPVEAAIGKYYKSTDYISHTNTHKGLLNKIYQRVRNYTLQKKAKLITENTGISQGKLLDVGAGTGNFLDTMKKKGWMVTGLEPNDEARGIAKKSYNLDVFDSAGINNLSINSFDAITLWHVLEHVYDLHGYIDHFKKLLKTNGKFFIAVPNYQSLDADIYRLNWAAYDVPRHLYHFTPRAMDVLMQKHSLTIIAKKTMPFDSYYISMLSSKYKNGHIKWISSLISGLRSNVSATFDADKCSSIIYIVAKTKALSF
ncbi:MAG: class I SAM-dependent methyltransferase [Chitinophagaceae bacterium]